MGYTTQSQRGRTKMSIGSEYWRKEVESLQSQLQEKTETLDEVVRQIEELRESLRESLPEIHSASYTLESSDGKELDPNDKAKGYKIFCENPLTGEKVLVKGVTDYDVLEIKYKAEREEHTRLLQRVAQQKSEIKVLHRKVNDLGHKYRQARRERDKLAEKLRIAENEARLYRALVLYR